MIRERQRHKAFLTFLRRIIDVPLGLSIDDLFEFKRLAQRDHPVILGIIDGYIELTERSESGVATLRSGRQIRLPGSPEHQMHLFDLLRERRLFPRNDDLSKFAAKILPNMSRNRFDKMSRGDIAARIIEYLETRDVGTKERLEASMRDALMSGGEKPDRKNFLSEWEKIIKGIEL